MRIYDVVKTAKSIYMNETSRLTYPGMCWCLKVAAVKGVGFKEKNRKGHPTYRDLVANIPEFNPEFLHAECKVHSAGLDFWWENYNTSARLEAFETLESIYRDSIREFEY